MHKNNTGALKKWAAFLAIVVALGLLVWLGWSLLQHRSILSRISSVTTDSSVTVGVVGAPSSIDIRTDEDDAIEQALLTNVYETLVTREQDNTLSPGLAEDWEISDDGLTYTFTIRSGVTFSNGDTLDSTDVVWSLQQIVQNGYVDAEELSRLSEVTNPDSTTVVITLSKPDPTLLRALAGRAGIVYDSEADIDYGTQAVGSGPFTVDEFRSGVSITLQRNDSYWSDAAATSQITLDYFDAEDDMVSALQNGEIELAVNVDADTAQTLGEDSTVNVASGQSLTKVILAFNNDADSIFSDVRMRQAVRYLVDNDTIANTQAGAYMALGGPIGPLDPGYEDLTDLYPYDVDKGAALGYSFKTRYYNNGLRLVVQEQYQDLAELIEEQVEQGNVPVTVTVLDDANYQTTIGAREFDMTLITADGDDSADDFADPSTFTHYTNATAQQEYDDAVSAATEEEYISGMQDFARTVSEDAASEWLYVCSSYMAASPNLEGYPTNMVEDWLPLASVTLNP